MCGQGVACKVSVYRGIIIQYDEDEDDRILKLVDTLPNVDLNDLIMIGEHEGFVTALWKRESSVPYSLRNKAMVDVYIDREYGDSWGVENLYLNNIKKMGWSDQGEVNYE